MKFKKGGMKLKKNLLMLIQFKFEHFLAENRAVLGI
jgi:hypothetical protein